MKVSTHIVTFLVYSCVFGLKVPDSQWKNIYVYIESVLRYQSTLQPVLNIWIVRVSSVPQYDDIITQLIGTATFQNIPRILMRTSEWEFPSNAYAIIFISLESVFRRIKNHLRAKYIVFGEFSNCEQLSNIARYCTASSNINVVYFSTTVQLTCYFEPYCKQIVSAQNFPDPATLFPDQTRNLCGHSIVATAVPSFVHIYHKGQDLVGPDVNFIQETARHINASLSLVRHGNLNGRNLHYKTIDIVLNRFNMARLGSLVSVEPFSYTVYVPRGRRLTQFELFVAPFQPLLWIFLGCLLISFKVFEFLFPRKLRRNFTFLTFFGFLNSAILTRITRVETFSIVLITIVMFFLFRAYETKVIAMMVNTPYLSTVKTLQQLVDTKFPIKLDFRNVGIVYSMPKLNKLVVKDIEHLSSPLDGVSAYLLRSDWADAIIFDPRNVDPISKMPLYVPVNEKLMISNGYYPISIYALHDRLMLTQRMLFEAGIRQLWVRNFYNRQYSWVNAKVLTNDTLCFRNIVPAWILLGIGCATSCVVFVGETIGPIWKILFRKIKLRF